MRRRRRINWANRANTPGTAPWKLFSPWRSISLAHQNRTIAIASDFRVDGAKSPEIPQKEGVLGSEIAARNRKSLATFYRTLKSQCMQQLLPLVSEIASDFFKNLLMPLFLMGCFPVDFQEVKRPLKAKSGKRPIKGGKRPIKEGKRPIKAMVLVGISVGCLMGCLPAPPPWRKTAPLKRPIKGSMISGVRDGHRNRKSQKSLRFRCAKSISETSHIARCLYQDPPNPPPR